jgi:hypothetical protein
MEASLDTRSTRAQRRAARRRSQHLVTADETSLVDLELFLSTLPLCASGRVFIEVPTVQDIRVIEAPGRMTVTWLAREQRTGAPGSGRSCVAGQALARATCAWADEMLCDEGDVTRVTLLGGYLGSADIVDHLTTKLGVEASNISAPERFGLLPVER